MDMNTKKTATTEVTTKIVSLFPNAIQIDTNTYAVPTGLIDEDSGNQLYIKVGASALATKATKTAEAFNIDKAVNAYNEKVTKAVERSNAPKKSSSKADPEAQARKEARLTALRAWVMNEMEDDKVYTTTEIAEAIEVYREAAGGTGRMVAGRDLGQITGEMLVDMNMVDGKKTYSKHC